MFELVLGLVLIVGLYARTFRYKHLIDDAVLMSGYLYSVPEQTPQPNFMLQVPSWKRRLPAIGCHLFNTWLVYLLLGGKAALLFAVFPVSVNNVAWITGSYYSCTTMLTLIAFYMLTHLTWWAGIVAAAAIYAVALNTTICTIAFPFVFLFANPVGLVLLGPLAWFLVGKRFTTGIKIRETLYKSPKIVPDVYNWGRFAFSVKLLALYLYTALVPLKLLFFRGFGARYRVKKDEQTSMDAYNGLFWASIALIGTWIVIGFVTGKLFWAMWFLILLAPFCQVRFLGQMFAERYIYPAAIGICAILALLPSPWYWILVGLYVMRSHMFIPTFESGQKMYANGIAMEPNDGQNYCNMSDWYLCVEPDYTLAGYYIQKHIALDPIDFKGYVNFASLWRRLKNYPNAQDNIKKAKELAEGVASPHIHAVIDRQLLWIGLEVEGKSAGLTKEEFDEYQKKQAAAV